MRALRGNLQVSWHMFIITGFCFQPAACIACNGNSNFRNATALQSHVSGSMLGSSASDVNAMPAKD